MAFGVLHGDGEFGGFFAERADAQAFVDDVEGLRDPEGVRAGRYVITEDDPPGPTITISLSIINSYELYDRVATHVYGALIALPPPEDEDDWDEWLHENIICFTGVGHTDGDSWYDITVTASSEPSLVGREFDWGY